MKEFKAESKRLMELMINSIYTNKEIFLREIISNASDAIDKLHYESLTNKKMKVDKKDFAIIVKVNKEDRTLTVSDNGIGMSKEELEKNLGTIAKSGSFDFKNENKKKENIDIIGQFGVGFYSAFMVASKVLVISKAYGSDEAYSWESSGIDGYEIKKTNKDCYGTDIILTIKDEEEYNCYLDDFEIRSLIKKYSDYITYPIKMEEDKKLETINSLVPLWCRSKKEISDEEYNTFYSDKFFDYEKPLSHLHIKAEGLLEYNSLIYIPSHASFDYYSKEYEKGLQLYSNGVLIMEKCTDLLPDYFSFVKGVVDSPDLSLNISREILQQNRVLKTIASNIEKHIKNELLNIQKNNREDYLKFWDAFGLQIKVGIYNNYGMDKDKIQDLLIFYSSKEDKMVTLDEYIQNNQDEKDIYYACGSSIDQIKTLPQVETLMNKGKDILLCNTYVDEFAIKTINKYQNKEFKNVCSINVEENEEVKEELRVLNEKDQDILNFMKDTIGIEEVKFTSRLTNHSVCLATVGDISVEMEKVMNSMPTNNTISAQKILEINYQHPIVKKLEKLYKSDQEELKKYSKVLYAEARLIEGLPIENPTEIIDLISEILVK